MWSFHVSGRSARLSLHVIRMNLIWPLTTPRPPSPKSPPRAARCRMTFGRASASMRRIAATSRRACPEAPPEPAEGRGRRSILLDTRHGDLRRAVGLELLNDMRADAKHPAPPVTTARCSRQNASLSGHNASILPCVSRIHDQLAPRPDRRPFVWRVAGHHRRGQRRVQVWLALHPEAIVADTSPHTDRVSAHPRPWPAADR